MSSTPLTTAQDAYNIARPVILCAGHDIPDDATVGNVVQREDLTQIDTVGLNYSVSTDLVHDADMAMVLTGASVI